METGATPSRSDLPDFDELWDYENPGATEAAFRALLPRAAGSGDRAYHAELLTQIARTEGLGRKFADAHRTLDAVQALLPDGHPRARVRYLLERGRVFNSAGDQATARPLFAAAWEQAAAAGETFHAIDAAHMLAIAAPPEERLTWNLRALALAESATDARSQGWVGSLYNNIGWTHHDTGRYAEALAAFQQAQTWQEARGGPREIRIARWAVARVLRSLDRVPEALAIQEDLARAAAASGDPAGYVQEELGECLLALGKPDAARAHFARAYILLSPDPWLAAQEPARLARLHALGNPPSSPQSAG